MWSAPEPGDIVWCRFPETPRDKPGPKPRPALVLQVAEMADGIEVKVAYGTSKKLGRLQAGEFAIRKLDNSVAYTQAGLSYDTKFDLIRALSLPWNSMYFAIPHDPKYGQNPKLGSLHSGMMKVVEAAWRATRRPR